MWGKKETMHLTKSKEGCMGDSGGREEKGDGKRKRDKAEAEEGTDGEREEEGRKELES